MRFQIYPETEVACKYPKPLFSNPIFRNLVEYKIRFDMKKLSLMNYIYFAHFTVTFTSI